jgi:hypothetical protein
MSFIQKIFQHLFQDALVNRLANSKTFQAFAVKTVDTHKALQDQMDAALKDPEGTSKAVKEAAGEFWDSFKQNAKKDFERWTIEMHEKQDQKRKPDH